MRNRFPNKLAVFIDEPAQVPELSRLGVPLSRCLNNKRGRGWGRRGGGSLVSFARLTGGRIGRRGSPSSSPKLSGRTPRTPLRPRSSFSLILRQTSRYHTDVIRVQSPRLPSAPFRRGLEPENHLPNYGSSVAFSPHCEKHCVFMRKVRRKSNYSELFNTK